MNNMNESNRGENNNEREYNNEEMKKMKRRKI